MSTKDIKREKHDCISRFQSHPKKNNEHRNSKALSVSSWLVPIRRAQTTFRRASP